MLLFEEDQQCPVLLISHPKGRLGEWAGVGSWPPCVSRPSRLANSHKARRETTGAFISHSFVRVSEGLATPTGLVWSNNLLQACPASLDLESLRARPTPSRGRWTRGQAPPHKHNSLLTSCFLRGHGSKQVPKSLSVTAEAGKTLCLQSAANVYE